MGVFAFLFSLDTCINYVVLDLNYYDWTAVCFEST
jgi:hypothetical protein